MALSSKIPEDSIVLIFTFLSLLAGVYSVSPVGVTYTASSTARDHLSSPEKVATALQHLKVSSVRLSDPDPSIIRAFSYSNVSLLLTIPNGYVPLVAANRSNALAWLYRHVVPFYPRAKITCISVGNDVLNSQTDLLDYLFPAIINVYNGLHTLGIRRISVSTTFSLINIVTTAFPPSAAEFQEPVNEMLVKPLLDFLAQTNSSFLINLYPYNLYKKNAEIPIGYALFQEQRFNFRDDFTTGVRYRNLFDNMVDALITAMAVSGHESIPVIVTEVGWPSESAGAGENDANKAYAELFLRGLIKHLRSGVGTPLRKEGVAAAYVYELLDEEGSRGNASQILQWGILYPNLTEKYEKLHFSNSSRAHLRIGLVIGVALLTALMF